MSPMQRRPVRLSDNLLHARSSAFGPRDRSFADAAVEELGAYEPKTARK